MITASYNTAVDYFPVTACPKCITQPTEDLTMFFVTTAVKKMLDFAAAVFQICDVEVLFLEENYLKWQNSNCMKLFIAVMFVGK